MVKYIYNFDTEKLDVLNTSEDFYNDFLKLDQTTPQSIINGQPIFTQGLKITAGQDIRPSADSTTAINIAQADGTDFVTFDTTNKRTGIGTTSPLAKLSVDGAKSSTGPATTDKGIAYVNATDNAVGLSIGNYSASPYAMWLQSMDMRSGFATAYALSLNPLGGFVYVGTSGAGTSSPFTRGMYLKNSADTAGPGITYSNTGATIYNLGMVGTEFQLKDSSGNIVWLSDANLNTNFGGYSPAPSFKLSSYDGAKASYMAFGYSKVGGASPNNGLIQIGANANYHGELDFDNSGNTVFYIGNNYNSDNSQLNFRVKGTTNAMTILGNGNVGIGTASPGAKLDVSGNAIVTGSMSIGSVITQNIYTNGSDLYINCGSAQTIVLSGTVWDDHMVDVGRVRVGASAPQWTAYRSAEVLAFDKTATNSIAFTGQLPHRRKVDSDIEYHIHMSVPDNNAGSIVWQLNYEWASIGSSWGTTGSLYSIQKIPANSSGLHILHDLGNITGTGKGISSILLCNLARSGGDANDTYDNNAYLISTDFHYQIDTWGSRRETSK